MQVLVLYYSKGGNTKKLAAEIAAGVEAAGVTAVLKNTSEVTRDDFLASAGVIAGSPVSFFEHFDYEVRPWMSSTGV